MHQGSPLLHIFRTLSRSLNCHPSAPQGHLHAIYPTWPWSSKYPHSTYFRQKHLSGHTVLIHSLHVPKPSQYSFSIPALLRISFIYDTPTKLPKTLHLKNIHFPSLSTSHTPCLCSVQCCWYNYSFILTLLRIYPKSSTVQHTFHCSPLSIPLPLDLLSLATPGT